MHFESDTTTGEDALPAPYAYDDTPVTWPATLDLSLETLKDVVLELEAGDLSHDRRELVVHLCNSIEAINALLHPNEADDHLAAPSLAGEASQPVALTVRSSPGYDARIRPSRVGLNRGASPGRTDPMR